MTKESDLNQLNQLMSHWVRLGSPFNVEMHRIFINAYEYNRSIIVAQAKTLGIKEQNNYVTSRMSRLMQEIETKIKEVAPISDKANNNSAQINLDKLEKENNLTTVSNVQNNPAYEGIALQMARDFATNLAFTSSNLTDKEIIEEAVAILKSHPADPYAQDLEKTLSSSQNLVTAHTIIKIQASAIKEDEGIDWKIAIEKKNNPSITKKDYEQNLQQAYKALQSAMYQKDPSAKALLTQLKNLETRIKPDKKGAISQKDFDKIANISNAIVQLQLKSGAGIKVDWKNEVLNKKSPLNLALTQHRGLFQSTTMKEMKAALKQIRVTEEPVNKTETNLTPK